MTITGRPAFMCAVGGVLPNPVLYTIETTHPYLVCTLYTTDDVLIGTLKSAARNGLVTFDVSSFLRANLPLELPTPSAYVTSLASLDYYPVFSFETEELSDSIAPRTAVLAALPYGQSDYQPYTV